MHKPWTIPNTLRYLAWSLLILLSYEVVGRLGLLLAAPQGFSSPIFPASGIALSATLILGPRYAVAVFLASFSVNVSISPDPSQVSAYVIALAIAAGATLQAILGRYLILKVCRPPLKLTRGRDIALFYLIGGPLGCLVSSLIGVLTLYLGGLVHADSLLRNFLSWWTGDVFGVLVVTPIIMAFGAAPRSIWARRRVSVALPLLSGLSLLIAFYFSYSEVQNREIEKEFQTHGSEIADELKEKLENYQTSISSIERFFALSDTVSRSDFRRLVAHSEAVQNHIIYAIWTPRVRHEEREAFERELNKGQDQSYRLFELDSGGMIRDLQARDEYFPIAYVEPDLHERAIGFDVMSDPKRKPLLFAARNDGLIHFTSLRRLIQDDADEPAIHLTRAVYRQENPATEGSRRESIKGYVSASFRLKGLIVPMLQKISYKGISLTIHEALPGQKLAELARYNHGGMSRVGNLSYDQALSFGGLTLLLHMEPNGDYSSSQSKDSAWIFMILGLLFTGLLGAFLLYVTGAGVEAEQQAIYAKLISDKFRKSEKNFRFLADSVPQLVFGADASGNVDFLNERWSEFTGIVLDRVMSNRELFHPEDRDKVKNNWLDSISTQKPFDVEVRMRNRQGSYRWQLVRALPQVDSEDGSIRWYGSCTDIHDQKMRSEELAAAEVRENSARESSRLKSEFLASMSHEIRTPINGVLGMTGLLLDTDLSRDQRNYAEAVKRSGEGLLTIINDILDFSKIEAGKMQLEKLPFPLVPAIDDAVLLVSFAMRKKNLDFTLDMAGNLPTHVCGDPGRLRQVLVNLLSNAVKFTAEGFVKLRVSVAETLGDDILLGFEVQDSGIGISRSEQHHLFRPFSQADSSTTRRFGGTGLGLTICKNLVEAMGGSISLHSEEGKGSTFRFSVKLGLAHSKTQSAAEAHSNSLASPLAGLMQKPRILLVEDVAINQIIACKILEKMGCRADVAANGEEALAALHSTPYDLVLMDCHMPVMDGFEATRRIRASASEELRRIPIIAMTANAMKGDMERCLEEGMNDYLSKPVDARVLAATVGKWLVAKKKAG